MISVARKPGSVISDSEVLRIEVYLEKFIFSSIDESIKFQSSKSDATISFSWISKRDCKTDRKDKTNSYLQNSSAIPSGFELFFLSLT